MKSLSYFILFLNLYFVKILFILKKSVFICKKFFLFVKKVHPLCSDKLQKRFNQTILLHENPPLSVKNCAKYV